METDGEKFFLGRQPILNRTREIIGYELLFRSAGGGNTAVFENCSHASASVITNVLTTFGIQDVLAGKVGFINVHLSLLFSEMLELLPIGQSVLELLETIQLDETVAARCSELKEQGFRLALDDHEFNTSLSDVYRIVDIVKLDILQIPEDQLSEIVRQLRQWPVQILAEKVETVEQFEKCFSLGFDLFQGYFFERPVILNRKRIDVSGMAMLKLLQQLTMDVAIEEIEQTFKENPCLSVNLLRLVNSVAIGMREKIKTLRHAILMLGMGQLRRWIHLSLFASEDKRGTNNPLLEMAAVRGRLMETLVLIRHNRTTSDELSEEAFMTGLLSLLDVLFEVSMSEILSNLNLNDDINNALLRREGQLGQLLKLAETVEVADFDAVTPLLEECDFTLGQLLTAQLEAFSWRSGVMSS